MSIMRETLKVKDVYGATCYISREDYERGRVQLRLYTSTGKRLSDHYEAMNWKGRATTLHRDNIAAKPATTKRIDIYCRHCGSRRVFRDATAAWNVETQQWEMVTVHDNADCEDCGGEATLAEAELAG